MLSQNQMVTPGRPNVARAQPLAAVVFPLLGRMDAKLERGILFSPVLEEPQNGLECAIHGQDACCPAPDGKRGRDADICTLPRTAAPN
jgi:hypothetical protein